LQGRGESRRHMDGRHRMPALVFADRIEVDANHLSQLHLAQIGGTPHAPDVVVSRNHVRVNLPQLRKPRNRKVLHSHACSDGEQCGEDHGAGDRHVGRVIRALRRARDWTQDDLAARAGVHPNTVSTFERDGRKPGTTIETFERMCTAMGCTVDEVIRLVEFLDDHGSLPSSHAPGHSIEHDWLLSAYDSLLGEEREVLRAWLAHRIKRRGGS
jgi:transcriptional regulator with XRE-family HTH domain